MKLKSNQVISAISPLRPSRIINTKTGELLTDQELKSDLNQLMTRVHSWAANILNHELNELNKSMLQLNPMPSTPAEAARQAGFELTGLPEHVLAKSRVNKLAGNLLISAYRSWANSPLETKEKPKPGYRLDLGAVDKQLATLQISKEIILKAKLWSRDYTLHFKIPKYLHNRKISKWSLPMIAYLNGEWIFQFAIIETIKPNTNNFTAGVDLGVIDPYRAVVLNHNSKVIGKYQPTGHARQLGLKAERVKRQLKFLRAKRERLTGYGVNRPKLTAEIRLVQAKLTRLKYVAAQVQAADLIRKLSQHNVSTIQLEDLRWVTGKKYGGRWNHSAQQKAIKHRACRSGIRVRRVNAKNTSQVCSKCESRLKPSSARHVYCRSCDLTLNRDDNAAINIARKSPGRTRVKGEQTRGNPLARRHTPKAEPRKQLTMRSRLTPKAQENST